HTRIRRNDEHRPAADSAVVRRQVVLRAVGDVSRAAGPVGLRGGPLDIVKTGIRYELVSTQRHFSMEGRVWFASGRSTSSTPPRVPRPPHGTSRVNATACTRASSTGAMPGD